MDNTTFITLSTHNINGYKRSKEFLLSQCKSNANSICAIQEHWLRPPYKKQFGVNQLRCLHAEFDGYGRTPLHQAAMDGNLLECKIIIANVEDKNPKDDFGDTPLHFDIYNNHLSVCQLMVNHFKDENPKDRIGATPLHMAISYGHCKNQAIFQSHLSL